MNQPSDKAFKIIFEHSYLVQILESLLAGASKTSSSAQFVRAAQPEDRSWEGWNTGCQPTGPMTEGDCDNGSPILRSG